MAKNEFDADQAWRDWFTTDASKTEKRLFSFFHHLPSDPRCKLCHSPFQGIGGWLMRGLYGRKQSSQNPNFCNICEDFTQKHPGGAEVEMAMLFVDVRGSTAMSEKMPPVEYKKMINRFYVEASQAIAAEDGLVGSLIGDAVAAFWGAGFAGTQYVARAVHAAQAIVRRMAELDIPVGVGVHAGVAYFGAMGSTEGLMGISAIGEEVNTAARLASKAGSGEIILSEAALAKAGLDGSGLEARRLELKGISQPVAVRVMRG